MSAEKVRDIKPVSTVTFIFYCLYLSSFLLMFTARVPIFGAMRLTVVLFIGCTVLLVLQFQKLNDRPSHEVTRALNHLLIYMALTWVLTTYPMSVLQKNLLDFLKVIAFFYFTIHCVDTKKRFSIVLILYVLCQVIRVLEPLYLNITEGYWGSSTYLGSGEFAERLSGSPYDIINPNELAFVILTIVPFLYFMLFDKQSLFRKLLAIALLIPLLYALILTMSRGGLVFLGILGLFIMKRSNNKLLLSFIAVCSIVAALGVMNDTQRDRYLSIFGNSSNEAANNTSQGRIDGMLSEFSVGLKTRPIFGNGLGTTAETKWNSGMGRMASHNFYAELLTEIGLFGLFFFYKFAKQIYKGLKSISTEKENRVTLTLLAVFVLYCFYSIQYFGLSQYYWYFLGGLVVCHCRLMLSKPSSIIE